MAIVAVLGCIVAGCASGDSSVSVVQLPGATFVLRPSEGVSNSVLEVTVPVVEDRIRRVSRSATASVSVDSDEVVAVVRGAGETDLARIEEVLKVRGNLQLAPVLSSDASSDGVPDKDGTTRYRLGPVAITGAALDGAVAELQSEWQVTVTVKDSAKPAAAKLFDGCFQGSVECPTRQMAIVLDGVVQSAPTVNSADLAAVPFVITSSFKKREAQALAAVLATEPLPADFTVRRR